MQKKNSRLLVSKDLSPKKSIFIVSKIGLHFHSPNATNILLERYIEEGIGDRGLKKVEISRELCDEPEKICKSADEVSLRYKKYIKLLSHRLNTYHKTSFDDIFWKKALSLSLVRLITTVHQSYNKFEKYHKKYYYSRVLDASCYIYSSDFKDTLNYLADSDLGREQMFSIYCELKGYKYETFTHKKINAKIEKNSDLKKFKSGIKKLITKILRSKVKVGLLGVGYSKYTFIKLWTESLFKINEIDPKFCIERESFLDISGRCLLTKIEDGAEEFDEFDKYFFKNLKISLPKLFVEDFQEFYQFSEKKLNEYKRLKYIVSEYWLSESNQAFFLAIADARGVKHIYSEHNCYLHQYWGNYHSHVCELVDKYLNIGWEPSWRDTQIVDNKIEKAGSFYSFKISKFIPLINKYNILYITGGAAVNMPFYSTGWGTTGDLVLKRIKFIRGTLNNIKDEVLNQVTYRIYPHYYDGSALRYDFLSIFKEYIQKMKGISDFSKKSKQEMKKAKLIIIDYISTSYLESLAMNIPTVVFYSEECYGLNDKYKSFFDELIRVKIFITDYKIAANHINNIFESPSEWWNSKDVKSARESFLKNLGSSDLLEEKLLNLAL